MRFAGQRREELYGWVEKTLVRYQYVSLNRTDMEHICHHEPNSMLIVWLLTLLALVIERLYRLRLLHRGEHDVRSVMDLVTYLWLSLGSRSSPDTG